MPRLLAEAPGAGRPRSSRPRPRRSPRWTSSRPGCATGWPPAPAGAATRGWAAGCWEARLWHTLDTELSAAEVLRRAWANLDRVTAEMREAAVELVGGPADDETVRRALDLLADEHPDDDTIVELAPVTLDEATEFVRDHDLVTLVDDPCVIQEMPEFARGVAVAYCDSPGPLETADLPTFYCIAPTPADWPARAGRVVLPRVQRPHDPQPDRARGDARSLPAARPRPPVRAARTRVRALGRSGPFVEGWAVYAEELMVGRGFGGLPVRLQQLKMQLRMTLNAILDQLVHCEDLPEAEAMALMTEPRLPGGGRGGRQVAPGAAHLDPALHLLRRLQRDGRDRRGPPGRGVVARLARRDAGVRLARPAPPAHPARDLSAYRVLNRAARWWVRRRWTASGGRRVGRSRSEEANSARLVISTSAR